LSTKDDLPALFRQSVLPESISAKADVLRFADQSGEWQVMVCGSHAGQFDTSDFLNQLHKGNTPFISTTPAAFSQKG